MGYVIVMSLANFYNSGFPEQKSHFSICFRLITGNTVTIGFVVVAVVDALLRFSFIRYLISGTKKPLLDGRLIVKFLLSTASYKVCQGKETVWIMPQWRVSLDD